jgi:ferredoxin
VAGSGRKGTGRRIPALIRACSAAAVLALFFYGYLSRTSGIEEILSLPAGIQFSAALYGAGFLGAAVLVFIAAALISGRVFCSVLCPLGTLQELVWRAGKVLRTLLRRKKGAADASGRTYRSLPQFRYAVLFLTGAGVVFSFSPFMAVLDPISTFGRGMAAVRVFPALSAAAAVSALPLLLILAAALFRGRAFCGWCPVGLVLGLCSRAAPFGMKIASTCVSCGLCEKKCPAACLDSRTKRIETERCVLCFSCAAACPAGKAGYGLRKFKHPFSRTSHIHAIEESRKETFSLSRRDFLKSAAAFSCGALYLLAPGLRIQAISGGASSSRNGLELLPPGAGNLNHYRARCIGCQACAAACPVGIIKLSKSPRPVLDYTEAACQYNCIACGQVCPTKAIRRLDLEEKHRTRIALSALTFDYCVVKTKKESCGACAEVCPTRALRMEAYPEAAVSYLTRPVFEERYCVGCGACLVVCPARPKAFTVSAVSEQTLTPGIRPTDTKEDGGVFLYQPEDDFPF